MYLILYCTCLRISGLKSSRNFFGSLLTNSWTRVESWGVFPPNRLSNATVMLPSCRHRKKKCLFAQQLLATTDIFFSGGTGGTCPGGGTNHLIYCQQKKRICQRDEWKPFSRCLLYLPRFHHTSQSQPVVYLVFFYVENYATTTVKFPSSSGYFLTLSNDCWKILLSHGFYTWQGVEEHVLINLTAYVTFKFDKNNIKCSADLRRYPSWAFHRWPACHHQPKKQVHLAHCVCQHGDKLNRTWFVTDKQDNCDAREYNTEGAISDRKARQIFNLDLV